MQPSPDRPAGEALGLPHAHAQRQALNDEVHARPSEPLVAPQRLSYVALLADEDGREAAWRAVRDLAAQYGTSAPEADGGQFAADLGPFRLRWERHTEFYRLLFAVSDDADAIATPAIRAVPPDWLAALPGRLLVAVHAALQFGDEEGRLDLRDIGMRVFGGNQVIGARVLDGRGAALTDFRLHADGFSRILVVAHDMDAWQAGRVVQRLLEIETYRMLALLAFPVARSLAPFLVEREKELAAIAAAQTTGREQDEPVLLERLTRVAAEIEGREADHLHRFGAASAYYELVRRRILELRELRIEGLTTFEEFTERRLAPAMGTCLAVAARQDALSRRVARATQLLATRVELTRERQAYAVLASMNRRAKLQVRLQQTVEGLSVAAITYYVVGLLGQLAKGIGATRLGAGLGVSPDLVTAVAVPVIALAVALGLRRARRLAGGEEA